MALKQDSTNRFSYSFFSLNSVFREEHFVTKIAIYGCPWHEKWENHGIRKDRKPENLKMALKQDSTNHFSYSFFSLNSIFREEHFVTKIAIYGCPWHEKWENHGIRKDRKPENLKMALKQDSTNHFSYSFFSLNSIFREEHFVTKIAIYGCPRHEKWENHGIRKDRKPENLKMALKQDSTNHFSYSFFSLNSIFREEHFVTKIAIYGCPRHEKWENHGIRKDRKPENLKMALKQDSTNHFSYSFFSLNSIFREEHFVTKIAIYGCPRHEKWENHGIRKDRKPENLKMALKQDSTNHFSYSFFSLNSIFREENFVTKIAIYGCPRHEKWENHGIRKGRKP